jgi:hypothetical protein
MLFKDSPLKAIIYKARPAAAPKARPAAAPVPLDPPPILVDGAAVGVGSQARKLSETDIHNGLNDLKPVILDIKGTRIKVWRRSGEKISCLSVYNKSWQQKIMVTDKQIEQRAEQDLSPDDFAHVPVLGMHMMYRIAKTCESDYSGEFEKTKLVELRDQYLQEVVFGEDVS